MVVVDPVILQQMVAMGIDEKLASRSLATCKNDLVLALECCFTEANSSGMVEEQDVVARTGHPAFRSVRHRMHVEKGGSEHHPAARKQCPRSTVQPSSTAVPRRAPSD